MTAIDPDGDGRVGTAKNCPRGLPSDELVAEVMAEWRIPGLAMAVVRRREPTLLRCWGKRDIDAVAPVAPDTVFPICSVTKSFTATALALLVDEDRLDSDTPVRAVLPEFRLRDTVATEQASLRDLLTHPYRAAAARLRAHGGPPRQCPHTCRAAPP